MTGTPTTQITKTVKLSSKYFGVSFGVSAMDNTYSDSDINLVFPDLIEMDQRQNTTSLDYRRNYGSSVDKETAFSLYSKTTVQQDWNGSKELIERGRVVDFVWAGLTAILSPNPVSKGIAISGMACSVTGWAFEAIKDLNEPKALSLTCSTLSFLGAFWQAWLSRSTIQNAYLDFIGNTAPGEDFFSAHELATMFSGSRTAKRQESQFVQFQQKLVEDVISNLSNSSSILFHSPRDNYSVVTPSELIGATKEQPAVISISMNRKVEHPYVRVWWERKGDSFALKTKPVSLYKQNLLTKRLSHEGEEACIDEVEEVEYGNERLYACNKRAEGEYASEVMYGENFYGNEQQWETTDYNIGAQAGEDNGGVPFANKVMMDADENQWSDACLCLQDNGQWISTGVVQLAQEGDPYYGLDLCYEGNCGADAM